MLRKLFLFTAINCVFALTACEKEQPSSLPPSHPPTALLRTITWSTGVVANLSYSGDSLLTEVEYYDQSSIGKLIYNWTGKKLTEFHQQESLYTNLFEYDSQGRVASMRHVSKSIPMTNEHLFEYRYDAQDRVLTMKYYVVNSSGIHLQNETFYHYHTNGHLREAVTKAGDDIITQTIDAFSEPVNFNACNYIQPSLAENYVIYNLPIMLQLSKVKRLPAKIFRAVKRGTVPAVLDRVDELAYTINNLLVDKVVTTFRNPAVAGSEQTIEATYTYF